MSVKIPATGAALAATGLSHFVKPQIYDKMTAVAFPNNTRRHVYIDGAIETAIGVAAKMVRDDLKAARRHALLKAHGHDVALSVE